MDKPIKKTEVFRAGQVEEHEIGLTFEEIECPTCDGGGEVTEEWEGIESTDVCYDCHGSGVFYVRI
ncbi:hypothetical protein I8752_29240 [Nostocaceae cyanobacterium CENA369]|uniref:Uncharacterized protein n=1 Tax=Dendronalium phyllosphericum CENA369 TaxID=1725256 RepID=A0A8J7IEJ0_9NOST|nr:hypothetical protein [Dendronalium phyllosphericum]MBH8576995.1 hypothetical protein [Dendronalium phyllosphericum CENA369]